MPALHDPRTSSAAFLAIFLFAASPPASAQEVVWEFVGQVPDRQNRIGVLARFEDALYAGGRDYPVGPPITWRVEKRDIGTGALLWTIFPESAPFNTASVDVVAIVPEGGAVYLGGRSLRGGYSSMAIHKVSSSDGSRLWVKDIAASRPELGTFPGDLTGMVADAASLYLTVSGSGITRMLKVRKSDGIVLWDKTELSPPYPNIHQLWPPAIDPLGTDGVYSGLTEGGISKSYVQRRNRETGEVDWQVLVGNSLETAARWLCAQGPSVYAASHSDLKRLQAGDGAQSWSMPLLAPPSHLIVRTDLLSCGGGTVVTATLLCRNRPAGDCLADTQLVEGFDAQTGARLWANKFPDPIVGGAAMATNSRVLLVDLATMDVILGNVRKTNGYNTDWRIARLHPQGDIDSGLRVNQGPAGRPEVVPIAAHRPPALLSPLRVFHDNAVKAVVISASGDAAATQVGTRTSTGPSKSLKRFNP